VTGVPFDAGHLAALGVTLAVEGGGMALLGAAWRLGRRRALCCAAIALGVNLVSHTVFWITFPLVAARWPGGLLGVEAVVALGEGVAYLWLCPFTWRRALSASALLNLLSLVAGVELWRLWP
jgi:hypothetical protein